MKKFTLISKTLALGILLATGQQSVSQTENTFRVNNQPMYIKNPAGTGNCARCFAQLADAVNSPLVEDNDTIYVEPSPTTYLPAVITKKLVIIGPGYFLTENAGLQLQYNTQSATTENITFNPGSEGSVLEGMSIGYARHVFINASDITIRRNRFVSGDIEFTNSAATTLDNVRIMQNYIFGSVISYANDGPLTNLLISNNYVSSTVDLTGEANTNGYVEQNVIRGNLSGHNLVIYRNNIISEGTIVQNGTDTVNNVYNNTVSQAVPWLAVPGNTNETDVTMGTVFAAATNFTNDTQLVTLPGCDSCNHGSPWSPSNPGVIALKGVYGGTTPYVNGGIPNIPTIFSLTAPGTAIGGQTTEVNVKSRSNSNN